MQLWQAFGPWGPRRFSAFQYVSAAGRLTKDWDWVASTLSVKYPPLPYLAPSSLGGIRDLQTCGLLPLRRTAPDSADAPVTPVDAATLRHAMENCPTRARPVVVMDDIRAPPACASPPPPVFRPAASPLFGG